MDRSEEEVKQEFYKFLQKYEPEIIYDLIIEKLRYRNWFSLGTKVGTTFLCTFWSECTEKASPRFAYIDEDIKKIVEEMMGGEVKNEKIRARIEELKKIDKFDYDKELSLKGTIKSFQIRLNESQKGSKDEIYLTSEISSIKNDLIKVRNDRKVRRQEMINLNHLRLIPGYVFLYPGTLFLIVILLFNTYIGFEQFRVSPQKGKRVEGQIRYDLEDRPLFQTAEDLNRFNEEQTQKNIKVPKKFKEDSQLSFTEWNRGLNTIIQYDEDKIDPGTLTRVLTGNWNRWDSTENYKSLKKRFFINAASSLLFDLDIKIFPTSPPLKAQPISTDRLDCFRIRSYLSKKDDPIIQNYVKMFVINASISDKILISFYIKKEKARSSSKFMNGEFFRGFIIANYSMGGPMVIKMNDILIDPVKIGIYPKSEANVPATGKENLEKTTSIQSNIETERATSTYIIRYEVQIDQNRPIVNEWVFNHLDFVEGMAKAYAWMKKSYEDYIREVREITTNKNINLAFLDKYRPREAKMDTFNPFKL